MCGKVLVTLAFGREATRASDRKRGEGKPRGSSGARAGYACDAPYADQASKVRSGGGMAVIAKPGLFDIKELQTINRTGNHRREARSAS
jgi:hypothetical protein